MESTLIMLLIYAMTMCLLSAVIAGTGVLWALLVPSFIALVVLIALRWVLSTPDGDWEHPDEADWFNNRRFGDRP